MGLKYYIYKTFGCQNSNNKSYAFNHCGAIIKETRGHVEMAKPVLFPKTKPTGFSKTENGSMMIIYAPALTACMVFSALVADIGMVMAEKQKLQNAVDIISLAAAQELIPRKRFKHHNNRRVRSRYDNNFERKPIKY